MNKRMMCAPILAMVVAMAMGCSDEGPGKGALDCTGGSRLELESTDVCVYRDPLLVETGFNCPAEAQYGSSYGDLVVCSPDEMLPADFFDEVAEQFPGDVPGGDCAMVVCDLGQVCAQGACGEPPDNNELLAELEVSTTSLDFGEVYATRPVARSISITNIGNAALELSDITVDGPFLYEDGASLSIEPGGAAEISVAIANDNNRDEDVTGMLSMTTNDPATPSLEVTLTASLAAQEPLCGDAFEPNDTSAEATAAALGTEYNAVLCMQDEDWWSFEVIDVSDHTLSITGPTTLDGIQAQLYVLVDGEAALMPNGRELTGASDTITVPMLAPGTYAWQFVAPPTPVAYALTMTNAAAMCVADDNEANDSMQTATRSIEDSDVGSGYLFGSLCASDVDWFVVQNAGAGPLDADLEVGRLIEVALTSFWGTTPRLTLHGPGGPVAATSSTASGANWMWEQLVYEVDVAGQYYVEVAAPSGEVLQYRLGVIARADNTCPTDAFEPNDDATSAAALTPTPGELLQVTDLYVCDADDDWFSVDLADGQSLVVNLLHSTTASFKIELFKEGETTARASDIEVPTSTDELRYTAAAGDGGRFLIRVSNQVPGSSARHYVLDVITD